MKNAEQIEIPLNKKLLLLLVFIFGVFAALGAFLAADPSKFVTFRYRSPEFIFIIGLISIVFCAPIAGFSLRRLLNKKAGLIINTKGITKSNVNSETFVPWSDIKEIKTVRERKDRYLAVIVKNPQDYIDRATSYFKRNEMKLHYKTFGSPIAFPSGSLQINFDDLYNLLTQKMNEYKQ